MTGEGRTQHSDSKNDPELRFAKTALERGVLSPKQIEECKRSRERLLRAGKAPTLAQVAVNKRLLTESQAEEITKDALPAGVPEMVGNYRIVAKIGEGGMGAVYKAKNIKLGSYAAVKFLPSELAQNENFVMRFEREARLAAQLTSAFSVRVFDVAEVGGSHAILMEYVDGESLEALVDREGKLTEKRALAIVRDVALALEEAHGMGIVHRDIKPANILLNRRGDPKVTDLGIAKNVEEDNLALTATGTVVGTPSYMSPEQARGLADIDARSDIYSLGATLYRMVVGELPFSGPTPQNMMYRIATEPAADPRVRNPELSQQTANIIRKMMAREREQRYLSMSQIIEDIRVLQSGTYTPVQTEQTVKLPQVEAETAAAAPRRGGAGRKVAAALVVLGLLGGAGYVAHAKGLLAKWESALGLTPGVAPVPQGPEGPGPSAPAGPVVAPGPTGAQGAGPSAAVLLKNAAEALGAGNLAEVRQAAEALRSRYPGSAEAVEADKLVARAAVIETTRKLSAVLEEVRAKVGKAGAEEADFSQAMATLEKAALDFPGAAETVSQEKAKVQAQWDGLYNAAVAKGKAALAGGKWDEATEAFEAAGRVRKSKEVDQSLGEAKRGRELVAFRAAPDAKTRLERLTAWLSAGATEGEKKLLARAGEAGKLLEEAATARKEAEGLKDKMSTAALGDWAKGETKGVEAERKLKEVDPAKVTEEELAGLAADLRAARDKYAEAAVSALAQSYPGLGGATRGERMLAAYAARQERPESPALGALCAQLFADERCLNIVRLLAASKPRAAAYASAEEAGEARKRLDEAVGLCDAAAKTDAEKADAQWLKAMALARRAAACDAEGKRGEALADAASAASLGAADAGFQDILKDTVAAFAGELRRAVAADPEKAAALLEQAGKGLQGEAGRHIREQLAATAGAPEFGRALLGDRKLAKAWVETIGPLALPGMVRVAAGQFPLGLAYQGLKSLTPSSAPQHVVPAPELLVDAAEVTNEEFKRFVDAGGYGKDEYWGDAKGVDRLKFVDSTGRPGPRNWKEQAYPEGGAKLPVVGVSWYEAAAYARWAGKRLPTEAEWECAAMGAHETDKGAYAKREFPWGDKYEKGKANLQDAEKNGPTEAGSWPEDKTAGGCFDMVGNVREWTSSEYAPYPNSECQDAKFNTGKATVRGLCFADSSIGARLTTRRAAEKTDRDEKVGFRCVWSPQGG